MCHWRQPRPDLRPPADPAARTADLRARSPTRPFIAFCGDTCRARTSGRAGCGTGGMSTARVWKSRLRRRNRSRRQLWWKGTDGWFGCTTLWRAAIAACGTPDRRTLPERTRAAVAGAGVRVARNVWSGTFRASGEGYGEDVPEGFSTQRRDILGDIRVGHSLRGRCGATGCAANEYSGWTGSLVFNR